MGEIKLFRLNGQDAIEIGAKSIQLEKSLQTVFEKNLDTFLGVRFLYSEYSTGKNHGGRIDSIGLDENGCPVIIEYKRAINQNVINQGLFYLDWLLDHKADFKLLVMETLGNERADKIDWTAPRLICVATAYTKYDQYAIRQINRNIDLLAYRRYGEDLVVLELVHSNSAVNALPGEGLDGVKDPQKVDRTVDYWLKELDQSMLDIVEELRAFLLGLGEDVSEKQLKLYLAYRRIKNFACVVLQKKSLIVYIRLNPETITLEKEFTRDVRNISHWATGDVEIIIRNKEDLHKAQPLIVRSYEES